MRKIAILNQKGGVGKTATAVNLAAGLVNEGKKVCLLDMDPQAHATLHVGVNPGRDDLSLYDVLCDDRQIQEVRQQINDNFWLIGSHIDLAAAEMELSGVVGRELILRDALENENKDYDYLIIDCPPSLSVLTLNALATVDEVIIPLQPHFLALHGLSKLLETISLVGKRLNPKIQLTGVLLCMYESGTRLASEVSDDVRSFIEHSRLDNSPWANANVFETKIRRNIRLAEAPSFGQTIFEYAASSNGAQDYQTFVREVLNQEVKANHSEQPFGMVDTPKVTPEIGKDLRVDAPVSNNPVRRPHFNPVRSYDKTSYVNNDVSVSPEKDDEMVISRSNQTSEKKTSFQITDFDEMMKDHE